MSDKAMPLDDARKDALKDTAARKRMAALFDSDTFVEVGALVKNGCDGAGVITGYGLVDGSPVYAFAQDASVRNGAVGAAHGSKIKKIYELVLKTGAAGEAPCVAGALCGDDREVSPGEVLIYSGGSTVRLNGGNITISGGIVNLTGRVLVNGKIVVTEG